jgi:hypothetical protein
MYACLYAPQAASLVADQQALFALAGAFSPEAEQTSADTVLFSVAPLRALLGSAPQIASEISRQGHVHKLRGHLAPARQSGYRDFVGAAFRRRHVRITRRGSLPTRQPSFGIVVRP